MSTERIEAPVTESSEIEKRKTITVNVPITITVSIPLEIEATLPDDCITRSEEMGCCIVDPLVCQDAAEAAVVAANSSDVCGRAMDQLVATALRIKGSHQDVDIYFTPFAGIVEEIKL